jgi:hypothetical protein
MAVQLPAILVENCPQGFFRWDNEIRDRRAAHGVVCQLEIGTERRAMIHRVRERSQNRGNSRDLLSRKGMVATLAPLAFTMLNLGSFCCPTISRVRLSKSVW